MRNVTSKDLRDHAERCARLADFQADSPLVGRPAELHNDLASLCFNELRGRLPATPSLREAEKGLMTHAAVFVLESFAHVKDPLRLARFKERIDHVLAVTLEDSEAPQSALGSALVRLVALKKQSSVLDSVRRAGNAVHELLHAAAPLIIKQRESQDAPAAFGSVEIVSQGWTVFRSERGKGPVALFAALEEVAAEAESALYYARAGGREVRVDYPVTITLKPDTAVHAALLRAVQLIDPTGVTKDYRVKGGVARDFSFRMASVESQFPAYQIRSAYSVMLAAMDDIAVEVFTGMPEQLAPLHQRDILREVQAFGEHRRYLKPLADALGVEGRTFLAELEPPSTIDHRGINNILCALFALAGKLPLEQRQEARSHLRAAQIEVQKVKKQRL